MSNLNQDEIYDVNESNVVFLVNNIFAESLRINASDIHIEPQEKLVNVRFRVDGQFVHFKNFNLKKQWIHFIPFVFWLGYCFFFFIQT